MSGCTAMNVNVPLSFVAAVRESPRDPVNVNVAPTITWPEGSTTVPVIDPVTVICAGAKEAPIASKETSSSKRSHNTRGPTDFLIMEKTSLPVRIVENNAVVRGKLSEPTYCVKENVKGETDCLAEEHSTGTNRKPVRCSFRFEHCDCYARRNPMRRSLRSRTTKKRAAAADRCSFRSEEIGLNTGRGDASWPARSATRRSRRCRLLQPHPCRRPPSRPPPRQQPLRPRWLPQRVRNGSGDSDRHHNHIRNEDRRSTRARAPHSRSRNRRCNTPGLGLVHNQSGRHTPPAHCCSSAQLPKPC